MLNNIVDNYEQYQYGSTTLLHPVFKNLEQVIIFCRVAEVVDLKSKPIVVSGFNTCRACGVMSCIISDSVPFKKFRQAGGRGGGQTKHFLPKTGKIIDVKVCQNPEIEGCFLLSLN